MSMSGFCSIVTLISAAVSLGYAISSLRAATDGSRIPSSYALARSAALVVVAGVAPFTASLPFIAAAALGMICVRALDAVIGGRIGDRVKTYGPAITAAVNAVGLFLLLAT